MPRTLARRLLGNSSTYLALVFVLACVGALGCPGTLDQSLLDGGGATGSAGTGGGPPCDAQMVVFMPKCGQPQLCHDNRAMTPGGLDLISANLGARLLGVVPTGANGSQCLGQTTPYLMAGSNPPTGLLLQKIQNPAPCGFPMPTLGSLTPSDVECITSWAKGLTSP